MFDKRDVLTATKEKRLREAALRLNLVAQAEVPANQLMGDPAWNIYQQQIAGAIEKMRGHEAMAVERLTDPYTVNHDALMELKIALAEIRGTIHAWEVALSLPRQIIDDAEKAREILDEFGDRYVAEQG